MTYTFMERMGNAHTHTLYRAIQEERSIIGGDIKVIVKKKSFIWRVIVKNLLY